jgi:site-specific DNA-methyltransferase (adenine-specific)
MEIPRHTVILGDARAMPELADASVHLVVTSPPYWQLKDYGPAGQIGFHDSYEQYINKLAQVWRECRRVLLPGCRLCINVGDQFARATYYGRYKVIPIHADIIRTCETLEFDFMGAIIWQKVTTCNTSGGAVIMGSFPHPRNGIVKLDYEHVLLFKKRGPPARARISPAVKAAARMSTAEWNAFFRGHWRFPGEKQFARLAPFPVELPRRLIRMFSFPGELVLDPFLGSGTTAVAAHELGRRSVGYELDPGALDVMRPRLSSAIAIQRRLSGVRVPRAPKVFHDVVRLTRRVDPRTQRYGSIISARDVRTARTSP